jgi:hypothetical protein
MAAEVDGFEQELTEEPPRRKRNRRAEEFGITFEACLAQGWAFDVCEAVRAAMDIDYRMLVDRERTKTARRANRQAKSIYRYVWTRGVPPLLSFERGHVFYDPPGMRSLAWDKALKVLGRAVRVTEAAPDGDYDRNGWVQFTLDHYEAGQVVRSETCRCSQTDFEVFLRSGDLSAGAGQASAR